MCGLQVYDRFVNVLSVVYVNVVKLEVPYAYFGMFHCMMMIE